MNDKGRYRAARAAKNDIRDACSTTEIYDCPRGATDDVPPVGTFHRVQLWMKFGGEDALCPSFLKFLLQDSLRGCKVFLIFKNGN